MQAALMIRSKQRLRKIDRIRRGIKNELPSNVATKEIGPFPRYPPASWCAQGKAAWQEAAGAVGAMGGRRCSVVADPGQGSGYRAKQSEAHLRWMKRNRIHDLSYGGSSSDEEDSVRARAAGAAGGLLYVGLGTVALGLVISFVGTGDKGFKTYELRLAGPALIAAGLACCLLRILLCACPARCLATPRSRPRRKEPAAERLLLTERPPSTHRRLSIGATALLLQKEKEAQQHPIQPNQPVVQQPPTRSLQSPPPPQPSLPTSQQNPTEDQPSNLTSPVTQSSSESHKIPPTLLPRKPTPVIPLVLLSQPQAKKDDSLIELQTMDGSSFDISSISSSEISVDNLTVIENSSLETMEAVEKASKLARTREPVFARRSSSIGPPRTVTFADTLNIIAPPSEAPPQPTEIVLTPSKLGQ